MTPHRRELECLVNQVDNPPASWWVSLGLLKIVWADGSELVIVAKGTATGCIGVQKAVLPKSLVR